MKKLLLSLVFGLVLVGCSSNAALTKEEYVKEVTIKLKAVKEQSQSASTSGEDKAKAAEVFEKLATEFDAIIALQGPKDISEEEKAYDESLKKAAETCRKIADSLKKNDEAAVTESAMEFLTDFIAVFTTGDKIDSSIGMEFR